jgi:CrcB protein
MKELLWPTFYVFVGGGIGSAFRFWVATFMQKTVSLHYPYGTLTVNVVGSFIIGFIMMYLDSRSPAFTFWRQLLVIGFLGGFTTFSSFSWDTITLFKNHETGFALLNIGANLTLCLLAAWAGSLAVSMTNNH